ncbi:MAG: CPBP family intramembrane metalloprotease, partial [bacterium]|nr:CPBP family intramembrane metalloprotease [bacterium]
MSFIKNIFWNSEESRLRAGYRVMLQLTAYFSVGKIIFLALGAFTELPSVKAGNAPLWFVVIIGFTRLARGVVSVWAAGRFLDRRPFRRFGLRFNKECWLDLGFGIGLGILIMVGIFAVELAAGWITITETFHAAPGHSFILSFLIYLFLFSCVAFAEELFYRGYQITNIVEGFSFKSFGTTRSIALALVFSSVTFGLFHLGSPNASVISTLNVGLYGILFGLAYVMTGSLALPIGIHLAWNLCQGNVFGFPVSGMVFPANTVSFFSIKQSGPDLWTGG